MRAFGRRVLNARTRKGKANNIRNRARRSDDSLLTPIVGELDDARRELLGVFCAMAMQIEKSGGKSKKVALSMPAPDLAKVAAGQAVDRSKWTLSLPSLDEYQAFFDRAKPIMEKRLVELNEEHDRLTKRLMQLPEDSLAVQKFTERIVELETEMRAVKADSENLIERLETLVAGFQQRRKIVEELREKFGLESAHIRKRELLQQVVSKIVLHFEYHAVKAANRPKSALNRVEICPVSGGEPTCFSSGSTLEPYC